MGSFVIGCLSVVPVFLISYPIFRWLAPTGEPEPGQSQALVVPFEEIESPKHQVVLIDREHHTITKPHRPPATIETEQAEDADDADVAAEQHAEPSCDVAMETRIDVIRMKDYRDAAPSSEHHGDDAETDPQPMDEALNYLLRQLRDSQQRKVA